MIPADGVDCCCLSKVQTQKQMLQISPGIMEFISPNYHLIRTMTLFLFICKELEKCVLSCILEELKEKLEKGGFEIESISETYGYLETVSNNLSYLITKANQENEMLYALAFPLLNMTAWLGRNQQPKGKGAGVLALARRPS